MRVVAPPARQVEIVLEQPVLVARLARAVRNAAPGLVLPPVVPAVAAFNLMARRRRAPKKAVREPDLAALRRLGVLCHAVRGAARPACAAVDRFRTRRGWSAPDPSRRVPHAQS